MSALVLCNMVPCIPDEGAERLDRFGECRNGKGRDGAEQASSTEVPSKENMEEETMVEDGEEEEGHEEEDEDADDEDADEENESQNSSDSTQECTHCSHHYSDRCLCCCNWAKWSESGSEKDGSFWELTVSENGKGEGGGEVECPQAKSSIHCVSRSPWVSHQKW